MPNGDIPTTVAQQVFSIIPGAVGGIMGFVLAQRLADKTSVPTQAVVTASVIQSAAIIGTTFIVSRAAIPRFEAEPEEQQAISPRRVLA